MVYLSDLREKLLTSEGALASSRSEVEALSAQLQEATLRADELEDRMRDNDEAARRIK